MLANCCQNHCKEKSVMPMWNILVYRQAKIYIAKLNSFLESGQLSWGRTIDNPLQHHRKDVSNNTIRLIIYNVQAMEDERESSGLPF